jgi:hypothetical protein
MFYKIARFGAYRKLAYKLTIVKHNPPRKLKKQLLHMRAYLGRYAAFSFPGVFQPFSQVRLSVAESLKRLRNIRLPPVSEWANCCTQEAGIPAASAWEPGRLPRGARILNGLR